MGSAQNSMHTLTDLRERAFQLVAMENSVGQIIPTAECSTKNVKCKIWIAGFPAAGDAKKFIHRLHVQVRLAEHILWTMVLLKEGRVIFMTQVQDSNILYSQNVILPPGNSQTYLFSSYQEIASKRPPFLDISAFLQFPPGLQLRHFEIISRSPLSPNLVYLM